MSDKLIVYGVSGTWWDDISKTAQTNGGLPCCPVCGSVLFQIEPEKWWEGAQRYEDDGHPGYVTMTEWSRGKCFPNMTALEKAYAERTDG